MINSIYIKYIFIFFLKTKNGKIRKTFFCPILGIFAGSYIIYMTLALMDGMENYISSRISGFNYPYSSDYILDDSIDLLSSNNGFERITVLSNDSFTCPVTLKSYDNLDHYILNHLEKFITQNNELIKMSNDGVYIGSTLSKKLNINIGDGVVIESPIDVNLATMNVPFVETHIKGIFELGLYDYDENYIITSNTLAKKLINSKIKKTYFFEESYVDQKLNDKYEININSNNIILDALRLEKKVYIFLGILVTITSSLMLFTTNMLSIIEKSNQISMLNILGINKYLLSLFFFLVNAIVGSLFILFGYLMSKVTIYLNVHYNLFKVIFSSFPFEVFPLTLIGVKSIFLFIFLAIIVAISGFFPILLIDNKKSI